MALEQVRNALLTVSDAVHHFKAPPNAHPDYIVWAEDGANDFEADGCHAERVFSGSVDLYTKREDSPLIENIPNALEGVCAWYLNSVQFEEDTGLIHYEWVVEA